jgi:hypothetical protein
MIDSGENPWDFVEFHSSPRELAPNVTCRKVYASLQAE